IAACSRRVASWREPTPSSPRRCAAWSSPPPLRVAERHQEHDALPGRVRGEEANDVVVEEGEAGRAQAERVRGEVALPALDRRLELGGAVAPVPVTREHGVQADQPEDADGRLGGERLPEAEMPGVAAELSGAKQRQALAVAV